MKAELQTIQTADVTHLLHYHNGAGQLTNSAFNSNCVMRSRPIATSFPKSIVAPTKCHCGPHTRSWPCIRNPWCSAYPTAIILNWQCQEPGRRPICHCSILVFCASGVSFPNTVLCLLVKLSDHTIVVIVIDLHQGSPTWCPGTRLPARTTWVAHDLVLTIA